MATLAITLLAVGFVAGLVLIQRLSQGDPEPRERRIPPEYDRPAADASADADADK